MKNTAKLIVVFIFALGALFMFLSSNGLSRIGAAASSSDAVLQPTPPKNSNAKPANANAAKPANMAMNMNMAANANGSTYPFGHPTASPAMTAMPSAGTGTGTGMPPAGDKKIPKDFVLGKDSLSEYIDVAFDHDSHAFKNYSPDGKSVIACVECHHTDQPKSALKPPLVTSERDEILTFAVYQKSSQKVSTCRTCHFQDGEVPDGKEMPVLKGKELNNKIAYHVNCNDCHDAAFKLRPEVKKRKGFATGKDCAVCHKTTS